MWVTGIECLDKHSKSIRSLKPNNVLGTNNIEDLSLVDLCVSGKQTPDGLKEGCYFLVKFWQAQASARRAWRRGGVPLQTVRSARKKYSFLFLFFYFFPRFYSREWFAICALITLVHVRRNSNWLAEVLLLVFFSPRGNNNSFVAEVWHETWLTLTTAEVRFLDRYMYLQLDSNDCG